MKFYTGIHQVQLAKCVDRAFISVNVLRSNNRRSFFEVKDWIMDSGAFTEISKHGEFRFPVQEYAGWINKFAECGNLELAVSQDYMCEPFMLGRTGLTVADHQRMTIERYDALTPLTDVSIMPVLQGYEAQEYVAHVGQYGSRLTEGMRVGVGSVCKRNTNVSSIVGVLAAIKECRPDLRLHGFGLKTTALANNYVLSLLYSADSMAWSYAARRQGRNANSGLEAQAYAERVAATQGSRPHQFSLLSRPIEEIG